MSELSDQHKDFIEALPEDLREGAEQYLPHWDKYVQEQFTQRAEEVKAWEPYSNIELQVLGDDGQPTTKTFNVRDIPPEELADLLAFNEIASDEEKFRQWYNNEELAAKFRNEQTSSFSDEIPDEIASKIAQLESTVNSLQSTLTTKEQQEQQDAWKSFVDGELNKIKEENPGLTEEDIDAICTLAGRYEPDQEIVQKGFKDFQRLVGRTELSFFEKKDGQPATAERGGASPTAAEPVRSYDDANEAARNRIREALRG